MPDGEISAEKPCDSPAPAGPSNAEEMMASAAQYYAARDAQREQNAQRTGGPDKKNLKADMKKSAAFVKRVKCLDKESDLEWALTQARALNLTRYSSEVAASLVQGLLDTKDDILTAALPSLHTPPPVVGQGATLIDVVTLFNCTYQDFDAELSEVLHKALEEDLVPPVDAADAVAAAKQAAGRRCVFFKVFLNMQLAGISVDAKLLKKILTRLTVPPPAAPQPASTPEQDVCMTPADKSFSSNLTIIMHLLRQGGFDFFGFKPAGFADDTPLPDTASPEDAKEWVSLQARRRHAKPVFGEKESESYKKGFLKYLSLATKWYERKVAESVAFVKECSDVIGVRGELPEEKRAMLAERRSVVKRHHEILRYLANYLDVLERLPPMSEDIERTSGETSSNIIFKSGLSSYYAPVENFDTLTWFRDEEERQLYEDFPDPADLPLPRFVTSVSLRKAILKKISGGGASSASIAAAAAAGDRAASESDPALETQPDAPSPSQPSAVSFASDVKESGSHTVLSKAGGSSDGVGSAASASAVHSTIKRKMDYTAIDALIKTLPEKCVGRVQTDEWLYNFLQETYAPSYVDAEEGPGETHVYETPLEVEWVLTYAAGCRKRLAKAIFDVPRGNFSAFPYYARVVASVAEFWKDFGPNLVSQFEEEFAQQLARQKQLWVEERRRNIRMLCELFKMGVYGAPGLLRCLGQLIDSFVHHNIDVCCHLLEGAGRPLYLTQQSSVRYQNLLLQIKRQRDNKNLDARVDLMLDTAIAEGTPDLTGPGKAPHAKKKRKREPLDLYVRHLLFTEHLKKATLPAVLRALRRLPWSEPKTLHYVVKNLRKVHKAQYSAVPLLVALAQALSEYHPPVGVLLVDLVLEDIRLGLELCPPLTEGSQPISPQKRLLDMTLLAELYASKMIAASDFFGALLTILYYAGYNDPPGYYFRIRLVCTALESGLDYLVASGTPLLYVFLPFFFQYIHCKAHPFPVDLDYKLADLTEQISGHCSSKHKAFSSFPKRLESANIAVCAVVAALTGKRGSRNRRLLGGRNPQLIDFIRGLLQGAGNPSYLREKMAKGVPADSAEHLILPAGSESLSGAVLRKQLLSNSIVPFRNKVHPLGLGEAVVQQDDEDEDEDEDDELEEEDEESATPSQGDRAAEGAPAEGGGGVGGGGDGDPVSRCADLDYQRGRFLIPSVAGAFAGRGAPRVASGGGDEEGAADFDAMFNSVVKDSFDSARRTVEYGGTRKSMHKIDDKIAQTMNIPLGQILKRSNLQGTSTSSGVPRPGAAAPAPAPAAPVVPSSSQPAAKTFAVVMRRKSEQAPSTAGVVNPAVYGLASSGAPSTTGLKIGNKSVSVGVIQVPVDSKLGSNQEDHRQRARNEDEESRRRILELQRQAQAEEEYGPGWDTRGRRGKATRSAQ